MNYRWPGLQEIKLIVSFNITIMDYQPFEVLKDKMQHVETFVFAAEENIGPVEI